MDGRIETAKEYLARRTSGDVDGVLALVTDDIVLNRGMMGAMTGKQAVADAIRYRPAIGNFAPTFKEPIATGDQVKIKGNLPPGSPLPVSSLTWTFSYAGDKISRVDVGF